MLYTDDPVADAERHYARQEAWLKRRPVCCECDRHIQDEDCFEFNGEIICPQCLEDNHKKETDWYVE